MELTNVLKYDRSLFPSKAVFFYKSADSDFVPLEAEINRIRGQKSGFTDGFTPSFTTKNLAIQDLAYSNILTIEECYVPPNVQHIYCRFSLRIQANSLKPSGCNDPSVFELLKNFSLEFYKCNGYKELAYRYCKNLLLGTWLWRNQNTGNTQISVKSSTGKIFIIQNTRELDWNVWPDEALSALKGLSEEVELALTNKNFFWNAEITAKLETSFCQEIFPSQVVTEKVGRGEVSKKFVKVRCIDGRHAVSFNTVKIGAAIQTIDDWWKGDNLLRVHEYGADQQLGIARRSPESEISFYSLFVNVEKYLEELTLAVSEPAPSIRTEIYYIFAVLIKGGMFQKKAAQKE